MYDNAIGVTPAARSGVSDLAADALIDSISSHGALRTRDLSGGGTGNSAMGYKIIKKADHQFIVRSEDQDILKTTSRRKAAKAIADANDLMRDGISDAVVEDEALQDSEPVKIQ
jgi:hypothetical protein